MPISETPWDLQTAGLLEPLASPVQVLCPIAVFGRLPMALGSPGVLIPKPWENGGLMGFYGI